MDRKLQETPGPAPLIISLRILSIILFAFFIAVAPVRLCLATEGLESVEGFQYGNAGGFALLGDVYRPAGKEKLPGVVIAHGGGFILGFRTQKGLPEFAKRIAERGYVVFNVDYRLIRDGGMYPNSIADVNCAIRGFKANAERFNLDAERVAVLGASAGGYLALMAGFTSGPPYELSGGECPAGDEDSAVSAIVDYYGLTDIKMMQEGLAKTLALEFTGKKYDEAPELYAEASPISHYRNAPPTLMLHGNSDHQVPVEHSRKLAALMKEAGLPVHLFEFEGADHGFIVFTERPPGDRALQLTLDFLDYHLKGACGNNEDNPFKCGG